MTFEIACLDADLKRIPCGIRHSHTGSAFSYLLPFLVIGNREGVKTLTLELYFAKLTSGQYGNPWELVFPAVLVTIIPISILYIFVQKYIVAGVADGAVKQ